MMLADPLRCLIEFSFYREVPGRSLGRVALYVAYLAMLLATVLTAGFYLRVGPVIRSSLKWASETLPPVTFSQGKASSPIRGPRRYQHPDAPHAGLVIDTDRVEAVTPQDMEAQKAILYLTQDAAYFAPPGEPENIDSRRLDVFQGPRPVTLDAEYYRFMEKLHSTVFYPGCWLAAFLVCLVRKWAGAFFYSLAGVILNLVMGRGLDYPALFKIAAYAQTPVVVLEGAAFFLDRRPGQAAEILLSWLLAALYTWQALRQFPAAPAPADGAGE